MDSAALFTTLLSSFLSSYILFRKDGLDLVSATSVVGFVSLCSLCGFFLPIFGQTVFLWLPIATLLLAIFFSRLDKKVGASQRTTSVFFCTFSLWIIANLILMKGIFLPAGVSVDGAAHYSLIKYLSEKKMPPGADWSFLWEIASYPFGYHISAATLANGLQIKPLYILFPFTVLLTAVSIASCASIAKDLEPVEEKFRWELPAFAFVLAFTSPYIFESYSQSGFYPMLTAITVITVCWWLTVVHREFKWGAYFFFALTLISFGLIYPQWGPLIATLFVFYAIKRKKNLQINLVLLTGLPLLLSCAVAVAFAVNNWEGLRYIFGIEGGAMKAPLYLLALMAAIALTIWRSNLLIRNKLSFFYSAVFLQMFLVTMSKLSAGLGAIYHLVKFGYILSFTSVPVLWLAIKNFRYATGKLSKLQLILPLVVVLCGLGYRRLSVRFDHFIGQDSLLALASATKLDTTKLTYIDLRKGFSPFPLWGYAITGKPQDSPVFEWWLLVSPTVEDWANRAPSGNYAVVRGRIHKLPADVEAIQDFGGSTVLRKK